MSVTPTQRAEIVAAVERIEPATISQIQDALSMPWEQRTTLRNRVYELVDAGVLIEDEGRPMRVAINQLHEAPR